MSLNYSDEEESNHINDFGKRLNQSEDEESSEEIIQKDKGSDIEISIVEDEGEESEDEYAESEEEGSLEEGLFY